MSKATRLESILFLIGFSIALIFPNFAQAKDPAFSFRHPDCKIKTLLTEKTEFLYDTLESMSEKRLLNLSKMKNKRDIYKGEMYFEMSFERIDKKLYDHCEVNLKIKLAKEDRLLTSQDETLYNQKNKRSLPRVTLKGNERCKRALRDAFVHIPTCIKQ
jgi:hypothetical protein